MILSAHNKSCAGEVRRNALFNILVRFHTRRIQNAPKTTYIFHAGPRHLVEALCTWMCYCGMFIQKATKYKRGGAHYFQLFMQQYG